MIIEMFRHVGHCHMYCNWIFFNNRTGENILLRIAYTNYSGETEPKGRGRGGGGMPGLSPSK